MADDEHSGTPTEPARTMVRAACPHDCPDTCAMLVTVEERRRVRRVARRPRPSADARRAVHEGRALPRAHLLTPSALLHPLRARRPQGRGPLRARRAGTRRSTTSPRASARSPRADGPQAIVPYSYAGTMGLRAGRDRWTARFFHRLGASLLDRTICSQPAARPLAATLGAKIGMDVEQFAEREADPDLGQQLDHLEPALLDAARRRPSAAARSSIASIRTAAQTAEKCHEHIALLPGTDAALALGLMHVLIANDWLDHDYIERHTLGFDALRERAARVSAGARRRRSAASTPTQIARWRATTARPSRRRSASTTACSACAAAATPCAPIACLPAWSAPGAIRAGGVLLSTSGTFPVDNDGARAARPASPGRTPRTINMSTIGDALLARRRSADSTRSDRLQQQPGRGGAGVGARSWRASRARTCSRVVLEHFQTDTADYADIVLPATTQLEHVDVHKSYGHLYVLANNPAIAPLGEAKPNTRDLPRLAARMGFDEPCFRDSDEELARPAFDERADGRHRLGRA